MSRTNYFFLFLSLIVFCGCTEPKAPINEPLKKSFILMDTLVEVTVYGDRTVAQRALDGAIKEMTRLDNLFDRHKELSFARKFNSLAGTKILTTPPEFFTVLEATDKLVKATSGSFDPTVAPLLDLYSFDKESPYIPKDDEVEKLLKYRDWSEVELQAKERRAWLRMKGMAIDLGGVAKGYIVDRGLERLRQQGVEAAIINAGGDLATFGHKPSKEPFRIGIQHPDDANAIVGVLRLTDCAVATSGDYERFVEVDDKRYHHLLNPKTGRPSRLSRSASVITSSALVADALATSVFVLGPKEGVALAERLKNVEASVMTPQGESFATSGFKKWLEGRVENE